MPRHGPVRGRLPAALLALALPLSACGVAAATRSTGTVTDSLAGASRVTRAPESDWPTFGANAARTGRGAARTGITARTLGALRTRVVHLAGTVDSAPIELAGVSIGGTRRDVVYVTTTYGRTIAVDAGTGRSLWQYTPRSYGSVLGSAQVTTTTPVADPNRRWVYAATPDGFVRKLSAVTGREVRAGGWPARVTWDARREKLAGALAVDGGSVVAVTGGYIGDGPVYQGHVVTIDRATGRLTHVFNSLCSNVPGLIDPPSHCAHSDSAIWAREGAVVEPGTGRLLLATGNGFFDGHTNWGDSVLVFTPALHLLRSWTPANQRQLEAHDTDLGSTAPALVSVGGRRLALMGGKGGRLYLLDRDRLDGTIGPAGPRLGGQLASIASPGGGEVLTSPAVEMARGRARVYVADDSGTAAYTVTGAAHPRITVAWQDATPGTSPVLAGGLLYVYDEQEGRLEIRAPGSGRRLASLPVPTGHWNSPIVAGGRIVLPVGTYHDHSGAGQVIILHLPGR